MKKSNVKCELITGTVEQRFWKYVKKTDGCWIWTGGIDHKGYGRLRTGTSGNFKNSFAHRISYELLKDKIPRGMFVCHSCDNPLCVNPEHLWTGTAKDNSRDMVNKGRTGNQRGEKNHRSILSDKDIPLIKEMFSSGVYSLSELGRFFRIRPSAIWAVKSGRTWKHINHEK